MGQELHQQKLVGQEAATLDELFVEFNKLFSRYMYLPLHSLIYKLAKRCENSSHVWLALSMLNTRGANGVALHDSVLRGVQHFYSDSGGKPAYQRNDLLPISPVVAEVWLSQRARGTKFSNGGGLDLKTKQDTTTVTLLTRSSPICHHGVRK